MKTVTITLTFEAFDDDDAQDFKANPTLLPSEAWLKQKYLESGLELAGWHVTVEQIRGESPKRADRTATYYDKRRSSSKPATTAQINVIEILKVTKMNWGDYRSNPDNASVCSLLDHDPKNLTISQASEVISFLNTLPTRLTFKPGAIVEGPGSKKRFLIVESKTGTVYMKVSKEPGDPYTYQEDGIVRLSEEIIADDPSFIGTIPCPQYPDISPAVGGVGR